MNCYCIFIFIIIIIINVFIIHHYYYLLFSIFDGLEARSFCSRSIFSWAHLGPILGPQAGCRSTHHQATNLAQQRHKPNFFAGPNRPNTMNWQGPMLQTTCFVFEPIPRAKFSLPIFPFSQATHESSVFFLFLHAGLRHAIVSFFLKLVWLYYTAMRFRQFTSAVPSPS